MTVHIDGMEYNKQDRIMAIVVRMDSFIAGDHFVVYVPFRENRFKKNNFMVMQFFDKRANIISN